jgi:hypothetical protein
MMDLFLGGFELSFEVSVFMGRFFELLFSFTTLVILVCDFKLKVSYSFSSR